MLLIKNGYVIDPKRHRQGNRDILIADGKIAAVRKSISEAFCHRYAADPANNVTPNEAEKLELLDATGLTVAPGFIDTHSHFRDPGFPEKEDMMSGSAAAARGGYTSVIMMANTKPPVDCVSILEASLEKADQSPIHLYSCANVTKGMQGKEPVLYSALAQAGAAGFTDDGVPVLDEELLRFALQQARRLHKPISLHEEDPRYIKEAGINAGETARSLGLTGADREAEISMIRRDVQLAIETGAPLCIQHISTAEGVELVRQARKLNPKIHAEATPHHFSLTEKAVLEKGTLAKVNPPLREESDRLAIIEGICDGTLDIIATDHAPHTALEKARPFTQAPSGMIGLETAFSLGLRELVLPGRITLSRLIELMTTNPASFYHLPAGRLESGCHADLVLFSEEEEWTVTENFASRASNSPFIGEDLPGVIYATIVDGRIVYRKE